MKAATRLSTGHVCTWTGDDEKGYTVTCGKGCNLGASRRQPTTHDAERRAYFHESMNAGRP